ncbi:MAG: hypothetical protein HFE63_09390 [Clostridiales bacterium]|nr:hypothetical protein [Clostridiales bacterium]
MLRKLIKHEFSATGGAMLLMFAAMLGLAGLTRLFIMFERSMSLFAVPSAISAFFYGMLAVMSMLLVIIIAVRRFYYNVYGDEGYLTLTLPVQRWQIIISKLLTTSVWLILDVIVVLLSVFIVTLSNDSLYFLQNLFAFIPEFFSMLIRALNMSDVLVIVEMIIMVLLSIARLILTLYAAMSIGQLFNNHRILGSIIGYVGINIASNIISHVYMATLALTSRNINLTDWFFGNQLVTISGMDAFNMQVNFIIYMLLYALITVGLYFITNIIMKRRVNLQ